MAMVTTDSRSNLYGNAVLYEACATPITALYSPQGCAAIPLGHNPGDRSHGITFNLMSNSATPGHMLFFGATRSGKGVSSIIPAALTTLSSCVFVDPKGELAWITGPRREAMGHRKVILDPWGEVNKRYGSQVGIEETISKFNPLSALDPADRNFNDDVVSIADAMVLADPTSTTHFIDASRELIAGLVAGVIELNPPGQASLRKVRDLIMSTDEELVEQILEMKTQNPKSLAARKLRKFARVNKQGEVVITPEIASIRSTSELQTAFLDSEPLLDAMETDNPPFDLEELVTGRVSLYLVLPPDRLSTHGRWLRMILTLALRIIARQPKPPALPVLFVLDEMGTVGPLRMVEDSYGLLAGLGVRIAGYLQNLGQLQRDYPKNWETFISNSSAIGLLQCGDENTSKYFSDYLGTGTIEVNHGDKLHTRPTEHTGTKKAAQYGAMLKVAQNIGAAPGAGNLGSRDAIDRQEVWEPELTFHGRPVRFPWEIRATPEDELLVMIPGKANLQLKRFQYYSDPVLSAWARHDPNKPAPVVKPTEPAKEAPRLVYDPDRARREKEATIAAALAAAPAPAKPPQSAAADIAGDLGNKLGGFLKRKLDGQ